MTGIILSGETIITSILSVSDGYYLTGSRKEKNYKIVVIKLSPSLKVEWERTFGNESTDSEGQSSILTNDGLLVCGCSEGFATDTGGHDWKAHLLKLDKSGNMVWKKAFRLMGNECAYNVLSERNIHLFGETKDDVGNCKFFISCLGSDGNPIWTKQYGNYPGIMAGGIISIDDGCIFSGNVKIDNAWHVLICRVDTEGDVEWEKKIPGNLIFQMHELEDGFLLAGEKSREIFLTMVDFSGNSLWDFTYGKGGGIALLATEKEILLGGENGDGRPVLCHVDCNGKLIHRTTLEGEGWIEAMTESGGKAIMAIHRLEPIEHTKLVTRVLEGN